MALLPDEETNKFKAVVPHSAYKAVVSHLATVKLEILKSERERVKTLRVEEWLSNGSVCIWQSLKYLCTVVAQDAASKLQ